MLRFNQDGKFKIMQIADTQENPKVSIDTVSLIEKALEAEKPDLVIFTGDQIKGYSIKYKNHPERVNSTIDTLVSPIVKRNIPFMVTYGNHDAQCGLTNKEQFEIYKRYKTFVEGNLRDDNDVGTCDVQIFASDSNKKVFNIYLIDSHGAVPGGEGYLPVFEEQIEWYENERDRLKEENGDYIPSLIFQHIPVPEFYSVIKFVEKKTDGAVPVYGGAHDGEYVMLHDETIKNGGFMGEYPASPDVNSGEFEKISEKGDVLGLFVGHDHINSFVANLRGVDLGYTQGAGFNVYGPGENRGVRLFVLDEKNPKKYKTYTRTFKELVGTKIKTPVQEFVYRHAPTSHREAKQIIIKAAIGTGILAGAYLGYKFLTSFNL